MSLLTPSEIERLGRLPLEAIAGEVAQPQPAGQVLDPAAVAVNERFVEFLHVVIARWAPRSPDVVSSARSQQDGWIYLLDARTPTPNATVPAEDIIGALEVRAGEIKADSYFANPQHRVVADHGLVQLDPFLRERFFYELTQLPAS